MQIKRVDESTFEKWRGQIESLLNQSVTINFPNCLVSEDYGNKKCDDLASYLRNGTAIVYVATDADRLIGWIWAHHIERINGARLHIAEIAVNNEYRSKGVGKILLEKVETYARNRGYQEIDLLVTKNNDRAVQFYINSAFETERLLMKKAL